MHRRALVIVGLVLAVSFAGAGIALADTVGFTVEYRDAAGTGFNAAGQVGADRRAAMEYAVAKFATQFQSQYAGETVVINVGFDNLAANRLGEAGPSFWVWGPGVAFETAHAAPLVNHVFGFDVIDGFFGGGPEIYATFGSAYIDGIGNDFYFGTDGGASGSQYDFATIALHETLHGLGFTSLIDGSTNDFFDFGGGEKYPSIYDKNVYDPSTGLTLDQMTTAQRAAAIRSGGLLWSGSYATAANGGVMPSLYSPALFASGSSVSHLDEATYGGGLMTPFFNLGEVNHTIDPLTLGFLRDIGWNTAVPEPGSLVLVGLGGFVLVVRRRRRARRAA